MFHVFHVQLAGTTNILCVVRYEGGDPASGSVGSTPASELMVRFHLLLSSLIKYSYKTYTILVLILEGILMKYFTWQIPARNEEKDK